MMKSKYIVGVLISAGFLLTACQSEPDVGSTLYPTEAEDYSVKAYISNSELNSKATITQGYGQNTISVPNNELTFKVKLTEPATKDLTFKAIIDKSIITNLGDDALIFEGGEVSIQQGKTESETEIKVALNPNAQSLIDFTGTAKIGITIESIDGVSIAKNRRSYVWELEKVVTRINPNGTLDGLSQLNTTDYHVYDGWGEKNLTSDGLISGDNFISTAFDNPALTTIHIVLDEAKEISAISLIPIYNYPGFGNFPTLNLNDVDIYMGVDQNNMSKVGNAKRATPPTHEDDPTNIVLFAPMTAKYIDIIGKNSFAGTNDAYTYTKGVRLYKK